MSKRKKNPEVDLSEKEFLPSEYELPLVLACFLRRLTSIAAFPRSTLVFIKFENETQGDKRRGTQVEFFEGYIRLRRKNWVLNSFPRGIFPKRK